MARRARLLIITPDFPPGPGGIQLMAHRLAIGIEGFQTRTITLDSPGAERFDSEGALTVRRVGASGAPHVARNALLNAVALREALRMRPDVVLSLHIVGSPAATAIRRALGARTVQYYHAKEIPVRPRLAAFAADQADVVIAVSDYTAELIAATGARPADLRLISPGVDIPADRTPEPPARPTILTVARLEDEYKGHDVMVRALASVREQVPDVEWVVLGEGSLRAGLERQVSELNLSDSVRFLGAVPDAERNSWLKRANLLAMPSRLPGDGLAGEGFGIAFLEAGAYGKPVVAGNVGGALASVSDGESGLLVDPLDAGAVAGAISRLLLDPDLAARLGSAGAARAQRFSWPAIARRVEAVLLEQQARPRSRRAPSRPQRAPAGRSAR